MGGHAQRGAPCSKGWKNSARSSRGWKKKFQSLETWPRQGGIAERCNAEGRNRRRRNPAAKHTAPPAREPERRRRNSGGIFPKAAAGERAQRSEDRCRRSEDGKVTVCAEDDSPARKGCSWERKSWAQRKPLAGIPGSGFRRVRLWSETPRNRDWLNLGAGAVSAATKEQARNRDSFGEKG
jgi:hypothetical protein